MFIDGLDVCEALGNSIEIGINIRNVRVFVVGNTSVEFIFVFTGRARMWWNTCRENVDLLVKYCSAVVFDVGLYVERQKANVC